MSQLLEAVLQGNYQKVEERIKAGDDIKVHHPVKKLTAKDQLRGERGDVKSNMSLLMLAAHKNDSKVVELLLKYKEVDPHEKYKPNDGGMHIAVERTAAHLTKDNNIRAMIEKAQTQPPPNHRGSHTAQLSQTRGQQAQRKNSQQLI